MKKIRTLTLICCLLLIYGLPTQSQDPVTALLGRINTLRSTQSLPPYTLHPALTAAAQNHARWMVDSGQVSHFQPDGSRPRDRAMAAGYGSSWVSENIYMGGLATVDSAWDFWLNSSIHYAGLTNERYQHIGIASASGTSGTAFVLVFGVPGGATGNTITNPNTTTGNPAAQTRPSALVGVDEQGHLMHQIQDGDTLGSILLAYGYTWDDLQSVLALNEMSEEDVRSLAVGKIVLVPPKDGTYTPSPPPESTIDEPQSTMSPITPVAMSDSGLIAPATFVLETTRPDSEVATPEPSSLPENTMIAPQTPTPTRGMVVRTLPTATQAAQTITREPQADKGLNRPPLWLVVAILFQVGVLILASLEFLRRFL